MQIHLAKPGGERQGPYSVTQIRQDLKANKYGDNDYWAWYDGLPEWIPLYKVLSLVDNTHAGVVTSSAAEAKAAEAVSNNRAVASSQPVPSTTNPVPENCNAHQHPTESAVASTVRVAEPASDQIKVPVQPILSASQAASFIEAPKPAMAAPRRPAASGMPFSALDQACFFTTGDAAAIWASSAAAQTVHEVTGEDLKTLRRNLPKDVISRCDAKGLLSKEGTISPTLWRAMAALQPALIEQARLRFYRVCIRTFRIEADAIVTLVLFYNKDKLKAAA